MKKLFIFVLIGAVGVLLQACNRTTIKLLVPTEYLDSSIVDDFMKEHDCVVDITTFPSNEEALIQVESGAYDVVIPSDYALEQMVKRSQGNLISELDYSLLPNYVPYSQDGVTSNLVPNLVTALDQLQSGNNGFDLRKYSAPYFWGNVGILYDSSYPGIEDLLLTQGWNALVQTTERVSLVDSSRDIFMFALNQIWKNQGITKDMNEATAADIAAATEWLNQLKKSTVRFQTDEILTDSLWIPSPFALAVVYSGDAIYLESVSDNPNLHYFVPQSGTNVFVDTMAIPLNANNPELAHAFINYLLDPEIQYFNSSEMGYTATIKVAYDRIIAEEVYSAENYAIELHDNDVIYRYNQELKDLIDEKYATIRS